MHIFAYVRKDPTEGAEIVNDNQAMFNALEKLGQELRSDHCWHPHKVKVSGEFPVQWLYRDAEICCFCGSVFDGKDSAKMERQPDHGPYFDKYVPRPHGCSGRTKTA